LIHGLGRRWQVLQPLIGPLSSDYHIFAPDLRGHGKSARLAHSYRGVEYSADISKFLREVVGEPAIVFGHSLGGMIGMYIAAHQPSLIRALILGDSMIDSNALQASLYPKLFLACAELSRQGGSPEVIAEGLADIELQLPGLDELVRIGDLPGNDQAYLLRWAECVRDADPDTYCMSVDGSSLVDWDGEGLLKQIRCPTLLLQANPDLGGLMSNKDVDAAVTYIANSKVVRFPTLGHALYMQQADPVLRAIREFLAQLNRRHE
jgi:pimeloyl-ACP methyl ester carboxylesterase